MNWLIVTAVFLAKCMISLASICTTVSFLPCFEIIKKKAKSHCNGIRYRFSAIRHTIPSCQLHGCNKRWSELRRKRAREEKGRRGGCGEALINGEKCIVPVSWADEKRQDKVQGGLLGTLLQSNYSEQPCIKRTHLGRKMVKNKLELQISRSWIVYWIQCSSVGRADATLSSKTRAAEYISKRCVSVFSPEEIGGVADR